MQTGLYSHTYNAMHTYSVHIQVMVQVQVQTLCERVRTRCTGVQSADEGWVRGDELGHRGFIERG